MGDRLGIPGAVSFFFFNSSSLPPWPTVTWSLLPTVWENLSNIQRLTTSLKTIFVKHADGIVIGYCQQGAPDSWNESSTFLKLSPTRTRARTSDQSKTMGRRRKYQWRGVGISFEEAKWDNTFNPCFFESGGQKRVCRSLYLLNVTTRAISAPGYQDLHTPVIWQTHVLSLSRHWPAVRLNF